MEDIQNIHNKLREELLTKRSTVYSDTLNFSVGEILNLYKDGDINLEPAFQRLFRWSPEQQSKFIESLLLGYPVPAIFVYAKENGVWDVVDGVQRISSLLNFSGLLDEENPLVLDKTDILEELIGKTWDETTYNKINNNSDFNEKDYSFVKDDLSYIDGATHRDLKRARIPVIILDNRSASASKYELFRRLNTGGSVLTPQETRNALILMTNEDVFKKMKLITEKLIFRDLFSIDESDVKVAFDMEVVTRYLILANKDILIPVLKRETIEHFIDRNISYIIANHFEKIETQLSNFELIINFISENVNYAYTFRKYDSSADKFVGQFSWLIFETVIYGLLNKVQILEETSGTLKEKLAEKIKNLDLPSIQGMRVFERMLNYSATLALSELKID